MDALLQQVQQAGVIGAGGAGFPTYLKLDCQVEWVLANGAECEPLLYKDQALMQRHATELFGGMLLAMEQVGAGKAAVGIKRKNADTIEILESCRPAQIELLLMEDVYPAGDEVELIYEATGRLPPAGGLPKEVGCLVNNVESFINLFRAAQGQSVTQSMVTVHGEVNTPYTSWLPVGMSFGEALHLAGGPTCDDYVILVGGPLMGSISQDLDRPITKIDSGLLVLPTNGRVARYKMRPEAEVRRIGKSACDQCSLCTSMCPRHLLGYPIQPHLAMRSLQVSLTDNVGYALAAQACSACNLCSMWSCPEGLDPSRVCTLTKQALRDNDLWQTPAQLQAQATTVHPLRSYRGVPTKRLTQRLELTGYAKVKASFQPLSQLIEAASNDSSKPRPQQVRIPLSQHIGAPAQAIVAVGDVVEAGQMIGQPTPETLSVAIHASINGTVTAVGDTIEITQQMDG
ncbi:4Fe-4S dicluster domain-containing protein [Ferrimonas lipolytica]|uniref:NADH dehydrogenase subunit n=1 Tax=Ferrimonas lipolytica TaxID=2724191 RepID=A0A6H1UBF3_9GAMM|nr:4Fe-4S dicluster domain-containing protein [Ferrimonas lipolytica]QIZ75693.1 NADH dehydrogenase subunit [Ferrimonas lipolytica]